MLAAFLVSDSAKTDRTDQSIADLVSADSDSDSESDPVDILPEETNALDVSDEAPTEPSGFQWFWFCMVFVMFAFGGWNDIAFVANEVKDSSRNLFGSLVIGTSIVVLIYLTFNVALLYGLGFEKMQQIGQSFGNAPAVLMQQSFGVAGNRIVSLLVCLSCLGAMNGMIFTSPRIYWATGKDYPRLNWLAGDPTGKGFWRAIVLQALVTEIFVLFFGSTEDGFEKLANANAPYFWLFLGFTVIALIVLRIKTDGQFQGYQIPFYPILPILFFSACVFMTYRSADYMIAQGLAFAAVLIGGWVLLGFAVSFVLGDHSSIDDQGSSSRSDQRIT
ncbi:MAG: APC family permease [Planctomycetota bacterium]